MCPEICVVFRYMCAMWVSMIDDGGGTTCVSVCHFAMPLALRSSHFSKLLDSCLLIEGPRVRSDDLAVRVRNHSDTHSPQQKKQGSHRNLHIIGKLSREGREVIASLWRGPRCCTCRFDFTHQMVHLSTESRVPRAAADDSGRRSSPSGSQAT